MNLKKIFAALSATAVATTMAVSASAEALSTKTGNSENSVNYSIDFSGLSDDEISSLTKIEAKVSTTSNFVNGCIGYNNASSGWTAENQAFADDLVAPQEMTWVLEVSAGDFAAVDDEGNIAPYAEVQFWWVNPNDDGTDGTATLDSVVLYAGDTVVASFGDVAAAGDDKKEDAKEETKTEETKKEDTSSPKTGATAGLALAGLALAGAAVVATKKSK